MDTASLKTALHAALDAQVDAWAAGQPTSALPPPPPVPAPPVSPPAAPAVLTGLPFGFSPLYEAGIRTENSPSVNAGRLNDLFASLSEGPGGGRAGGGLIRMTEPGIVPIGGPITLMPGVSIKRESQARFGWAGPRDGYIFASRETDVLTELDLELYVDEGAGFAGVVIRLHSIQGCRGRCVGFGNGADSTFAYPSATSTAGDASSNGGRNFVFNKISFAHRGLCGVGFLSSGLDKGFGGQSQVVTLNDFNVQFNNCAKYGIRPDSWFDTNTFKGNNYAGMSGPNSVGFINNPQSPDIETGVYNLHFEQLAVDTFPAGQNLHRYGVALFAGKAFTCASYMNDPPAENGSLIARASCQSYDFGMKADNSNALEHLHHNLMDVAR